MICEDIALNDEGTAHLYTYCLDAEYSYGRRRTWPAVVIVPGGGYLISATKEGEAVAAQFLARGYSCFVLRYSTFLRGREGMAEGHPQRDEHARYPTQELQLMEALHLIHERAQEWAIDEDAIFTCGFSAGGHISGSVACRWDDPALTSRLSFAPAGDELRPAGCVLGYPMLSGDLRAYFDKVKDVPGNIAWQGDMILDALYGTCDPTPEQTAPLELIDYVGLQVPPTFVWHSVDDPVVDPAMTTRFVAALQQAGVPCEYHLYATGGHGLACANAHYAKDPSEVSERIATWLPMAAAWMDGVREAGDTLPA